MGAKEITLRFIDLYGDDLPLTFLFRKIHLELFHATNDLMS